MRGKSDLGDPSSTFLVLSPDQSAIVQNAVLTMALGYNITAKERLDLMGKCREHPPHAKEDNHTYEIDMEMIAHRLRKTLNYT